MATKRRKRQTIWESEVLVVRLRPEVKEQLREESARRRISMNVIVGEALESRYAATAQ